MKYLAILFTVGVLAGCANAPLVVRVLEYDAGGGMLRDATLGGCSVMTSENEVAGELVLTYNGEKCSVDYATGKE